MNNIKLMLYTAMLITSYNTFGMQYLLNRNIPEIQVKATLLLLKYPSLGHLNEEEQAQILANPDDIINNKNLSKSDPSVIQLMEKANRIRNEERKKDIREKRRTI